MSLVTFETDGPIGLLRLSRPEKLNALTPDMLEEIAAAVDRAEVSPDLRALVIHSEGKAFSVGADINIWSALTPEEFRTRWIKGGHRAFDSVAGCRLPVIAALHGMAFGGGLELALAADLRIAERGTILALPETSLGTVPGWGGTQRLTEIAGRARAKQMILAAERIDAETAAQWGLVNTLCEEGDALTAAKQRATEIAARAPIAVQIAKQVIDGRAGEGLPQTLEMLAGMATQSTGDLKEGISALKDKRDPVFGGR
ncbi:enoyl-CoA hydratase/isomerase family protein [Histidinibacterium aquaticum]|uniref:Enoyl-CoA hydratase/isomerase family protein n=1 Tax=Histidinibacterium aquaticum TaxID=2613962 RepID=A0A5J5GPQ6_9RHOB|nr:enoyl-CoA hydratase/isomerase family protein [Histidinibacterium aquaticum]KAA9010037.1 enoyl-CoA hydratase/isomerase family protein [Histidinibacterium aquaticum]